MEVSNLENTEKSDCPTAQELCRQARSLWMSGQPDRAEPIYRNAWNEYKDCEAGEKLALLYLQSSRPTLADAILQELGYKCRLAKHIFDYPTTTTTILKRETFNDDTTQNKQENDLCQAFDDFLLPKEMTKLRQVFADVQSEYWTCQNYSVEPPSPYCSYIIPLDKVKQGDFGTLGNIIRRIQSTFSSWKPEIVQQAQYCEMWAHNRPHCTGHQLHFDSDNEGRGSLRHPIMSVVLYTSDHETSGPTLITHQRRVSRQLAYYGYTSLPRCNRCVAFDGRILHGVLPGKGSFTSNQRRVSLMLAFWKNIRTRTGDPPKAALAWPEATAWAKILTSDDDDSVSEVDNDTSTKAKSTFRESYSHVPIEASIPYVDGIYESVVDGEKWPRRGNMPTYDEVYQGF